MEKEKLLGRILGDAGNTENVIANIGNRGSLIDAGNKGSQGLELPFAGKSTDLLLSSQPGKGEDFIDYVLRSAFERVDIRMVSIDSVQSFKDYPFELGSPEIIERMAADIKSNGLQNPVILRPIKDTKYDYEMIDGHRRAYALKKVGEALVKAYVVDCDDATAAVLLCEYNLKNRDMLPTERGYVFSLELTALKQLVKRSQNAPDNNSAVGLESSANTGVVSSGNSAEVRRKSLKDLPESTTRSMLAVRHGTSAVNLSRSIRLTQLIFELQQAVDQGQLPFNTAVALSHLRETEQMAVYRLINRGRQLSLTEANALKKKVKGRLELMSEMEILAELGEVEKPALSMCTCTLYKCPNHPRNHNQGCTPCIEKNLRQGEIPDCFYKKIGVDYDLPEYTIKAFARLALRDEPGCQR